MSGTKYIVDEKTIALIRMTVRESMQAFGFRDLSVRAGEDHEGDPVFFIEVDYNLTATPIDMAVTAGLTTKLRDKLWAIGETRFPHIRHKFSEEQTVKKRRRATA
jgi:hypothetical protein